MSSATTELGATKASATDRPNPDDCDHVDFHIERDHLEDVPEGTFRVVCLRCGWVEYRPVGDLEDYMSARDLGRGEDQDALIRPDDAPGVWVFGGGEPQDDEPANPDAYCLRAVEGGDQ